MPPESSLLKFVWQIKHFVLHTEDMTHVMSLMVLERKILLSLLPLAVQELGGFSYNS